MDSRILRLILFLPEAASSGALSIDALHFVVIGVTMIGATSLLLTALYFVVRYRRRGSAGPTPRVAASNKFEVGHTLLLLSLFLAFWAVGFAQYARMQEPPSNTLDVRVVAKQWMWTFAPDGARATMGYLVVPIGRPVRITLTSRDVIHSFYVPSLRLKRDAVPGRYTMMWFEPRRTGVYPIYCAEFCGTSHSRMAADLVIVTAAEYRAYLAGRTPSSVVDAIVTSRARGLVAPPVTTAEGRVARGHALARQYACLTCHTLDGRPSIGPSWKGLYDSSQPLEGGRTVHVDEAYLRRAILDPPADVAVGFRPVMPTYYREKLEAQDVDALVAFIRSQSGAAR